MPPTPTPTHGLDPRARACADRILALFGDPAALSGPELATIACGCLAAAAVIMMADIAGEVPITDAAIGRVCAAMTEASAGACDAMAFEAAAPNN